MGREGVAGLREQLPTLAIHEMRARHYGLVRDICSHRVFAAGQVHVAQAEAAVVAVVARRLDVAGEACEGSWGEGVERDETVEDGGGFGLDAGHNAAALQVDLEQHAPLGGEVKIGEGFARGAVDETHYIVVHDRRAVVAHVLGPCERGDYFECCIGVHSDDSALAVKNAGAEGDNKRYVWDSGACRGDYQQQQSCRDS